MFKKIKNAFSNFMKDNAGLSIVTVIVAIGFVLIIVSVLMVTSTINFKMKNVNVQTKESFYSAEQVLDEIRAGLTQVASEALSSSYKDILTSYTTENLSPEQKNEQLRGAYYNKLIKKLGYAEGTKYKYYVMPTKAVGDNTGLFDEGLYSYLKNSTRWNDTYGGAFLRAKGGNMDSAKDFYIGDMEVTAKDGIFLKDLIVYYRDSNGIVSEIKTDIHLIYPGFAFSNPSMPEISSYTLITDSGLIQESKGSVKAYTTSICGDSYAYLINTTGVNIDYKQSATGANPKADTHIIATDFDVVNGSIKTYDTTRLWVNDIIAKSSDVYLSGYTYVKDDINLKGASPELHLRGYYFGYGNSLSDSGESSAILINGSDTKIDLEAAKTLTLAGRAYIGIGKNKHKGISPLKSAEAKAKNISTEAEASVLENLRSDTSPLRDVYMGSSIAAKSDQLMYLVPAECIANIDRTNTDGTVTRSPSAYSKNPLTDEDINTIKANPATYDTELVDRTRKIAKLGATANTLDDYVKPGSSGIQEVVVKSKDGTKHLHYYYLNFASDEKANQFFALYYKLNKTSVDQYMRKYIAESAFVLPSNSYAILTAGTSIPSDKDIDPEHSIAPGVKKRESDEEQIADGFNELYEKYNGQFMAYQTVLSASAENLEDVAFDRDEDNKAVFDNLIDHEILEEICAYGTGGRFSFEDGDNRVLMIHQPLDSGSGPIGSNTQKLKTVKLGSTDLSKYSLIIADCDIEIESGTKFEGTMLVKGKITLPKSNFEFKANPKKVNECMTLATDDDVYEVLDVFRDVSRMTKPTAKKSKDSKPILTTELVTYNNWTRSADVEAGMP